MCDIHNIVECLRRGVRANGHRHGQSPGDRGGKIPDRPDSCGRIVRRTTVSNGTHQRDVAWEIRGQQCVIANRDSGCLRRTDIACCNREDQISDTTSRGHGHWCGGFCDRNIDLTIDVGTHRRPIVQQIRIRFIHVQ